MAKHDAANVRYVVGSHLRRPPMLRMSCAAFESWMPACIAWMTEPAPRKRHALKNAWVKTWKNPAEKAPTPTPRNMNPSWLTVEYASTFLMSFCTSPIVAAKNAVAAPIVATVAIVNGERRNTPERRHKRDTPAVTIVAARVSGGE